MKKFFYSLLAGWMVFSGCDKVDVSGVIHAEECVLTGNNVYLKARISSSAEMSDVYFLLSKNKDLSKKGSRKIPGTLRDQGFSACAASLDVGSTYYCQAVGFVGRKQYAGEVFSFHVNEELEAVDIGIVVNGKPVKWASCNIGASKKEEYGNFYAWGETDTKPYKDFVWSKYKWGNAGNASAMTKYKQTNMKLEPEDDVAQVQLGGGWRMPTPEELQALAATEDDKANYTWQHLVATDSSGEYCRNAYGEPIFIFKITQRSTGRSLILPAAGHIYNGSHKGYAEGWENWDYWASATSNTNAYQARVFHGYDVVAISVDATGYFERCEGVSVRAVCE